MKGQLSNIALLIALILLIVTPLAGLAPLMLYLLIAAFIQLLVSVIQTLLGGDAKKLLTDSSDRKLKKV
jgi:hypothetical protein